MPKRKHFTPAETRALIAQVVPGAKIGALKIEQITPTGRAALHQSLHVVAVCACGKRKTGYVREYLDALRLGRTPSCRSCHARASVGRQWAARKTVATFTERLLAKWLFVRHRRAAQNLGIDPNEWPESFQPEVVSHWSELVPDAKELLDAAMRRRAAREETAQ